MFDLLRLADNRKAMSSSAGNSTGKRCWFDAERVWPAFYTTGFTPGRIKSRKPICIWSLLRWYVQGSARMVPVE